MLVKLNDQLQKEFYSAYLYLSMEAYMRSLNLDGFASWFRVQTQEERDHAMAFFSFINKVGGEVTLQAIPQPRTNFSAPQEVFEIVLQHEQGVTQSIHALMDLAQELKDHTSQVFLHWFITEQAEEEENVGRVLHRLKLIKQDSAGLFMIDNELSQRVYAPVIIPV